MAASSRKTPAKKTPAKKVDGTPVGLLAHLASKPLIYLKALLRKNDQLVTGTRAELVARVIDRVTHGNLPRCPQCFLGRMKMQQDGTMACPGGYDDDEYKACGYLALTGSIERPAWRFEVVGLA